MLTGERGLIENQIKDWVRRNVCLFDKENGRCHKLLIRHLTVDKKPDAVTDIAIDRNGKLLATTYKDIFTCGLADAKCTWLAAIPSSSSFNGTFNGLTFAPKGIPAAHASTGEQKAALIGLVLAHSSLLVEMMGYAPILLLDEVVAHLDPSRRAALYDALARLDAQVWMTGADPAAFADIAGRALQKLMRNLQKNTCAVTGARITALRTAMGQILQNLQALLHNLVGFLALDIDDKADSAGILFLFRVIEALLRWKPGYPHHGNLVSLGRR
mgnify:CR=1 FL=1